MNYKKIIIYGENLEVYEYEKEPDVLLKNGRRASKSSFNNSNMGIDREDTFSERQLGRRQDNARRAGLDFRRLVACNLSRIKPPLLFTITYKENITDITVGYKDYRAFVQALRYKYGKNFKYVCVPEFQKRGAIHFHALFWGLPIKVFLQERKTREIARVWRKGFIYLKETNGNDALSFYLSKYMSKAFIDPRLKNQKAYVCSRNIERPRVISGTFVTWPIFDEYAIQESNLMYVRNYETMYLGKCKFRHYKIPNYNDANL